MAVWFLKRLINKTVGTAVSEVVQCSYSRTTFTWLKQLLAICVVVVNCVWVCSESVDITASAYHC